MKTLDPTFAFLHTLELGPRNSSDFRARGLHVIGKHHDMVDADNIQMEWSVAATGERRSGLARKRFGWRGPYILVDHRQTRDARNRIGATYEREVLQSWR